MITLLTYLRSILSVAFLVPFTAVCSLLVILLGSFNRQDMASHLARTWAQMIFFLLGIQIVCGGEEHLPESGGGIIVFNHQSLFDIPALVTTTEKTIRFGAKIELFKIPFFGAAMRSLGTLPIARQNRSEVLKIYKDAEKRFRENTIFVLAPEGTRQHDPLIGRFKKGPFLFAINGQVPVIPAVIKGAYEVLPRKSLGINIGKWSRTIRIEYLPAVSTAGLKGDALEGLVKKVQADMTIVYEGLTV